MPRKGRKKKRDKYALRHKIVYGAKKKNALVKALHTAFDKGKLSSFAWKKMKTSTGKATKLWAFEIQPKRPKKKRR